MSSAGVLWGPIAMRVLKRTFKTTSNLIKAQIAKATRLEGQLQPILVRSSPRQPIHPSALRKGRWFTTSTIRRFMSTESGVKYNRAAFPKSATASRVSRLRTSPFASTLRPNLTGGALPRSAGGYGLGSARAFSHTATPAQVVNDVSAAIRGFLLSGSKAQFDGMTPMGEKRYRRVSTLQEETGRKMKSVPRNAPGSFIDFHVHPQITALTPLSAAFPFGSSMGQSVPTLNTEGFLDVLSVDFSRALKDLAATLNDLKRLSSLGDLPITLEQKSILRVRFPGCDSETVERLCDEVGVQRGIIYQDEAFERTAGTHMALLFPFAPSSHHVLSSPGGSLRSQSGHDFEELEEDIIDNPWLEGYESMEDGSDGESAYFTKPSQAQNSSDYEGLEGIYRFLEQCDSARRI